MDNQQLSNILNENERLRKQRDCVYNDLTALKKDYLELTRENEQLKSELRIYRKLASCSNCEHHNYDWNVDDGYGGEEYEVCDKGNDMSDDICEDWREL